MMFYYVKSEWPGSVHDSRVLRNSNLFRRMSAGWRPIPGSIILADSAYPLLNWLIPPSHINVKDEPVLRFNRAHKATRRMSAGWRPIPGSIILADSAYPLLNWLIPPSHINVKDEPVLRFNRAHKATRRIVENSIGILKEKFPVLNYMRVNPRFASNIFKACTTK
jgi:hypothetical protein